MSANIELDEAVRQLYATAVERGASTSTKRLDTLAGLCVTGLAMRGLPEAKTEVKLPGGAREKTWDVAWFHDGKVRLAISLKSILANIPGTVPNRTDDLVGEVANLQMYSPEVVIGYVIIFNIGVAEGARGGAKRGRSGTEWLKRLAATLEALSGRRAPSWSTGMIEAFSIVVVDFSEGPRVVSGGCEVESMLDTLAAEVKARNPGVL